MYIMRAKMTQRIENIKATTPGENVKAVHRRGERRENAVK
jgi:hypothetical protein